MVLSGKEFTMTDSKKLPIEQLRCQRLLEFIESLEQKGLSQRAIAVRACVPTAYFSDVKLGRRGLTELFARRLQDEFGVDHQWLMGLSNAPQPPRFSAADGLPVLGQLIDGPPRTHACWYGSVLELSGVGAERAAQAHEAYALKFSGQDRHTRLQPHDLVLISQTANEAAQIHVVRLRGKLFLARRGSRGRWEALEPRRAVAAEPTVIGHCVGILWGRL